ncbi:hypothetical protein FB480_104218 [Agrobacterium vitis]|nr:hypothetical protein FB480_104218 [Agrobacterium vitis]
MTDLEVYDLPASLVDEAWVKADEALRLYSVSTASASDEDLRKSTRGIVAALSELHSMFEEQVFKQVLNNCGYDVQREFKQAIAFTSGAVDDSNLIEPLHGYQSGIARLNATFHSLDKLRGLVPRVQRS